jgi:hypothetical protein
LLFFVFVFFGGWGKGGVGWGGWKGVANMGICCCFTFFFDPP